MSDRPEWVKCIETPVRLPNRSDEAAVELMSGKLVSRGDRKTWCGIRLSLAGFTFTDLDHAAQNGLNKGRLVACSACVDAAIGALREGSNDEAPDVVADRDEGQGCEWCGCDPCEKGPSCPSIHRDDEDGSP